MSQLILEVENPYQRTRKNKLGQCQSQTQFSSAFWVQQLWGKKNVWSKINVGSKKCCVQKKSVGPKNVESKNTFGVICYLSEKPS